MTNRKNLLECKTKFLPPIVIFTDVEPDERVVVLLYERIFTVSYFKRKKTYEAV
jgi:hypothetical protein